MDENSKLDVDLIVVEDEDRVDLMVDLRAAEAAVGDSVGAQTIVVVLDRSGSMAGPPLAAACHALSTLVTRLRPQDSFGLVVFDDTADPVVPTAPVGQLGVAQVQAAIHGIGPGSTTDLSAGYLLGLSEAARAMGPDGATVVLVSDGHANAGERSSDRLGELARARADKGIATTTVGLGLGYDDELLVAMARGGNGNHVFADGLDDLVPALTDQVAGLLTKTVTAVSATIRPTECRPSGIRVVHDYPTALLGDQLLVHLGDLTGGESRKLLVEFDIPQAAALGVKTVAEVIVRYTAVPELEEHALTLPVTVNLVPGEQPPGGLASGAQTPDGQVPGRLTAEALYAERSLQQAQSGKRAAIDALRDGRSEEAAELLGAASGALSSAIAAVPEELREPLEEDMAELGRLESLARSQQVERTVKSAYESMTSIARSRSVRHRRSRRTYMDERADSRGRPSTESGTQRS
ncbi:MAG TPA: VWA domain-containing protein [Nocardioidaceae bacterium]|nr:VWA domain-containing protein [Nocardioidaceae bacterium]